MIADEISPAELRALLTIRRAELESTVAESYARLAQVESRLRGIEGDLPAADVVIKELPAVRLVGLTTTAASFTPEDIRPVVRPLCAELGRRLPDTAVRPTGRLTCLYERAPRASADEDEVVVRATVPATVDAGGNPNGADGNVRWDRGGDEPVVSEDRRQRGWDQRAAQWTLRWWICLRYGRRRWCTAGRSNRYCPRGRRWPAGSTTTTIGPASLRVSSTSTPRTTQLNG